MLNRILAKLRPTPASSMAVALLGVALGLGSTGWAANGGNFLLGLVNAATQKTGLVANLNGAALAISNTSAGASARALTLAVAAGHPPMTVNSTTKVANLNADFLDGLDSAALTKVRNVSYSLAAGGVSAAITVPPDRPVQVIGLDLTSGSEGLGEVSLVVRPGGLFQWAGIHSYSSGPAAFSVFADGGPGHTIVFIDFQHKVAIETGTPGTIRIHNTNTTTQSGTVSLMW